MFQFGKTKTVFNGKHLKMKVREFKAKDGKIHQWEFVERKPNNPPVIIFAITPQKEVVLEKVCRVPFKGWVLELPAGLQDQEEETSEEVAKRELLEETGYKAEKPIPLLQGPVSAGSSAEELSFYFADDAVFYQKPQKEATENIKTVKIPLQNLPSIVMAVSSKNYANLSKESLSYINKFSLQEAKVDIKILSILPVLKERGLLQ